MSVLYAHAPHGCLQKLEDGIGFPGTIVTAGCESPYGTEPGSFARAVSALNALSHLSCPIPKINKTPKPKPLSPALSAITFAKVIMQWHK